MNKFKYHITVSNKDWWLIERWCEEYIGEFDTDWYKLGIDPTDYIINGKYETHWYFAEEKDAILFKLKWA